MRDLRDKRLWPVAAALLVALIGIPAFLSSTAASTPAPSIPPSPQAQAGTAAGLPVVSVNNAPAHSRLTGRARDPFKQQGSPASPKTTTTSTATSATASSGAKSGSSSAAKSTSTTPSTTSTTTTSTTPTPTPPSGLSESESYDVALSITNASGGLDTIPAVERLTILPNRSDPLLVELGVLKGGKRVLFAVQPGAVVRGSGRCMPGRIDCEILSLAPNQVESVKHAGATSGLKFAVTGIATQQHGSAAAASRLRNRESAAGRRLLSGDRSLVALSLFRYVPGLGAILDVGNLKVG